MDCLRTFTKLKNEFVWWMEKSSYLILQERIGEDAAASVDGALSLWDAVGDILNDVRKASVGLVELRQATTEIDEKLKLFKGKAIMLNKLQDDFNGSMQSVKTALEDIRSRLAILEDSEGNRPNGTRVFDFME